MDVYTCYLTELLISSSELSVCFVSFPSTLI